MEDKSYPSRLIEIEFELDAMKEYFECYYGCKFEDIPDRGDNNDPECNHYLKNHMWKQYDRLQAEYDKLASEIIIT